MNTFERESRIAHYDKYLSHTRRLHVSFDHAESLPRITEAVKSGDLLLNTIPLRRWDAYHYFYANRSPGIGWSLVESVCTAKIAALKSALKLLTGIEIESGEQMQAVIESLGLIES